MDRIRQVLLFICDYKVKHGYVPAYKEIGDGVGLKSNASVNYWMDRLFDEDYISTDEKEVKPRAWRITMKGWEIYERYR